MIIGKHRKAVIDVIKSAGKEGVSMRDITRKTKLQGQTVIHCLLPEDMIYEEKMPNGWTRYFWCGK